MKVMRPLLLDTIKKIRRPTVWELVAILIGVAGLIQAELHYGSLIKFVGAALGISQ